MTCATKKSVKKFKRQYLWCVVDASGEIAYPGVRWTRKDCIKAVVENAGYPWKELHSWGWHITRVCITEDPAYKFKWSDGSKPTYREIQGIRSLRAAGCKCRDPRIAYLKTGPWCALCDTEAH